VTALLLASLLLVQDPASPAAPEPRPPASEASSPARAPDAVELPPTPKGEGKAAERAPRPGPERPRPAQTGRLSSGRPDCRNLAYADAHPEVCGAGLIGEPEAEAAPPPPLPITTPSEKSPVAETGKAAETSADAPPSPIRIVAVGGVALALMLVLSSLLLRPRATSSADVRQVELRGPETQVLSPVALARGVRGPGKSRWSIRDGRLILTGPAGTLLNGVRLDRAGDIVSTGDTVRLGGAEYRVEIV
jgi:hypothetical protein